jgi:hypothetical protein
MRPIRYVACARCGNAMGTVRDWQKARQRRDPAVASSEPVSAGVIGPKEIGLLKLLLAQGKYAEAAALVDRWATRIDHELAALASTRGGQS